MVDHGGETGVFHNVRMLQLWRGIRGFNRIEGGGLGGVERTDFEGEWECNFNFRVKTNMFPQHFRLKRSSDHSV